MEAIAMLDAAEKIKTVIETAKSAVEFGKNTKNQNALKRIDETAAETFRTIIGDSVTADALDGFAARHTAVYRPSADLFSKEYRARFLNDFIQDKPQALPLRDQCERAVNGYLDELNRLLSETLDAGDLVVPRRMTEEFASVGAKLDTMDGKLDTLLDRQDPDSGEHSHNALFAERFTETLFLHRERNPNVTLKNLYTPHRFQLVSQCRSGDGYVSGILDDYLNRFIRRKAKDIQPFLLIEGDAGCGKTSLSAYLVYQYEYDRAFREKMFGEMELLSVRLRELDIKADSEDQNRLAKAIQEFLNIPLADIRKRRPVLLLDGYDELCHLSRLGDPETALYGLRSLQCKIILTCRPQYVNTRFFHQVKWHYPYEHIQLQHFDWNQRKAWLSAYTEKCGEMVEEETRTFILGMDRNSEESICDTPMGLYMVAAGRFDRGELDNEWALYRRIFRDEQRETSYNALESDWETSHPIGDENWENIYRINEELAFSLYKNQRDTLQVTEVEVMRIIRELCLENEDTQELLKRCYALCGYWKTDPDRGAVEFYHNNIRDFFLCEKITRELNDAYKNLDEDPDGNMTAFLKRLTNLFQYSKLEDRALDFVTLWAEAQAKDPYSDWCGVLEKKRMFLRHFFQELFLRGDVYRDYMKTNESPLQTVIRILQNMAAVFARLYLPIMGKDEYIHWWIDVDKINTDGTFRAIAGQIMRYAPRSDLSGGRFSGVCLPNADWHGVYLRDADLSGADLHFANLSNANLSGVDFQRADLHGAVLRDADLYCANLHGVDLRGANLSNANFGSADLSNAYLDNSIRDGHYLQYAHNVPDEHVPL